VQMMSVLFFKQLGSTMRTDLDYVGEHYGRGINKRIIVPSGLVPITKQYGSVSDESGDWEIVGQAVFVSTFLLRGIGGPTVTYAGVVQPVDRTGSIGFDASMPHCWAFLVDWARGVVNQWCHGKRCVIMNGANRCTVESPVLVDGFETFFAAFQMSGFPPHVLRALRIGHQAEGALRVVPIPVGNLIPAPMVALLNAQGVVVFNWRRDEVEVLFAEYYGQVQSRMQPTLDTVFTMVEVTVMGKKGELSQMVSRTDAENAFIPQKIPGDQMEMGVMTSTPHNGAMHRAPAFRVESEHSPLDMLVKWFEGMKRGKKKEGQ